MDEVRLQARTSNNFVRVSRLIQLSVLTKYSFIWAVASNLNSLFKMLP